MSADLTPTGVDFLLEQIARCKAIIDAAEAERDATILIARNHCANKCAPFLAKIEDLTERLRRYAAANLPEDKKTIKRDAGILSFRKQEPRFYFDDKEANSKDERLLAFAKAGAPEFVKRTEYVDWEHFKRKLIIDGESVFYKDTGELIDGLHAQILPDKFTVKTV